MVGKLKNGGEAVGVTGALAVLTHFLTIAVWTSALVFSLRVNVQEKGRSASGEDQLA